jgi:hypothetical protein
MAETRVTPKRTPTKLLLPPRVEPAPTEIGLCLRRQQELARLPERRKLMDMESVKRARQERKEKRQRSKNAGRVERKYKNAVVVLCAQGRCAGIR